MTMSSLEIAVMTQSRHDNVRIAIQRLAEKGVITLPAMQEKPTAGRPIQVYLFVGEKGKRDSIIVVAQLSPAFTARLVDRWQELEAQVAKPQAPALPQSLPEALRLAADEAEKREKAESALAIAAPKAEALDMLANVEGLYMFREAADLPGPGRSHLQSEGVSCAGS